MKIYALVTVKEDGTMRIARGSRQKLRTYTSLGHAKAARRFVSGSKILEFTSGDIVEVEE
jgi:hypothetical protein